MRINLLSYNKYMKINKISCIKELRDSENGLYTSILESQEIFNSIVGKPDAFAVLAYLFLRFGPPTLNNSHDSKILFEYDFHVDGVFITIHGNTGDNVYFRAYIPAGAAQDYLRRYNECVTDKTDRLHAAGIPYVNGCDVPEFSVPAALAQKNVELWNSVSAKYLEPEEKEYINHIRKKMLTHSRHKGEKPSQKEINRFYNLTVKANNLIIKNEIESFVTEEEKRLFRPMFNRNAFPDITAVAEAFCRELLEPRPVRDKQININGIC